MKRWIFLIAIGVVGAAVIRTYGFEGIYVATPSMEPTLPVGTNYFVDKISFIFRSPKRSEIIVFTSPVDGSKDLIKRVIALPGEAVSMKDKHVYVNGEPLKEPYAKYKRKDEILSGDNLSDLKIPEDSYFVLGDNRDESQDSTSWKDPKTGERIYFVRKDQVKGRLMNVLE